MKINRLFEIVYILLNTKQVTAKELADRFEVSQRTIYRDIDILSSCNIPIYTNKGKGGGIGLLDNAKMDKAMLTTDEQAEILSALQGLKATDIDSENNALNKLSSFFNTEKTNWIEIDFSSFSANSNWKQNFETIKNSILQNKRIEIEYANLKGEMSNRTIEPIKLIFKGVSWYLQAYCTQKNDYRMFKLNRIIAIEMTDEIFSEHQMPNANDGITPSKQQETLVFRVDGKFAFRIYDDFPKTNITKLDNGDYEIRLDVYEKEWLVSYILSLGDHAECIQPEAMRNEIKSILAKSMDLYNR